MRIDRIEYFVEGARIRTSKSLNIKPKYRDRDGHVCKWIQANVYLVMLDGLYTDHLVLDADKGEIVKMKGG